MEGIRPMKGSNVMKKVGVILAAVGVLAAGLVQPVKADEVLRVAMEGTYPPFNWTDSDGTLKGFEVDLTFALCEKIGRECVVVAQDWDGMIPGLLAKKYDLILASMSITEERMKKIDFTKKYYETPTRMVARKGANLDVSAEGLNGVSIGVQRATTQACYVKKFHSNADIKLYAVQEDGYSDLLTGRIDGYVAESLQIQGALLDTERGKDFEFVDAILADADCLGRGVGIGLRKGNEELRDALSQAILDIRADGTYKAINDKTFAMDIYGPEEPQ